jgi:hypothetical protein
MDGEELRTVRAGAVVTKRRTTRGGKRILTPRIPNWSYLTHQEREKAKAFDRTLDDYERHQRLCRAQSLRSVSPKVPKHDGDITLSLAEVCAAHHITPKVVGIRCRNGSLPWPLRDQKGKNIKPLRWQLRTLLIHQAWRKAKCTNEQRRFSREQEAQEAAMFRRPSLLANDPARDNVIPLRQKEQSK